MNINDFLRKTPWWQQVIGVIVVSIVIAAIMINSEDPASRRARLAKPREAPSVEIGQTVPLQESIIAGRTEDDWDEVSEAIRIKDTHGWKQKISNGTAYALQKGQMVKRIDYGIQLVKIRVENGPNTGKACYVPTEYLTGDWK